MTEPVKQISTILSSVLASGRAHFNARVVDARHRHLGFNTDAFSGFLRTGLDDLALTVEKIAPASSASVIMAAYDIALELVAMGLVGPGARTDVVERAWKQLIPPFARLVAADPVEILSALSNAAVSISSVPTARFDDWLKGMAVMAEHVENTMQFRCCGLIMAWRAGMAHFRPSAFQNAEELPEKLALLAMAAMPDENWNRTREAYCKNIWWSPSAGLNEGLEIGQFSGLGGSFSQPPELRACAQGFFVRSANRYHLLIADAYGAVLLPASAEEYAQAEQTPSALRARVKEKHIVMGDYQCAIDLPEEQLLLVENQHTLAITSPYSHAIQLLPLR
jgi:hypothetical protein